MPDEVSPSNSSVAKQPAPIDPTPGLNPGVSEPHFSAWRNFVQAYGVIYTLQRQELDKAIGMQMPWYEVLLHLNEAGGSGLDTSALQESMVYSQSGLSQLLTRMNAEGLLTRRRDDNDRRRVIVNITQAGVVKLGQAAPIHRDGIVEHFTQFLNDDEAVVFAQSLERIIEAGRNSIANQQSIHISDRTA